jgi:methylenetetrahydrofolate reductase (NADPH)
VNRTSNEARIGVCAGAIGATIRQLAQEASVEINVHDVGALEASRRFLPQGKKIFISHLPGQAWEITADPCRKVRDAGFIPIPHIPIRLIDSASVLE